MNVPVLFTVPPERMAVLRPPVRARLYVPELFSVAPARDNWLLPCCVMLPWLFSVSASVWVLVVSMVMTVVVVVF